MRDEDIIELEEPKLTAAERMYMPQILDGFRTTVRHMLNVKRRKDTVIVYPEAKHKPRIENYRGMHRLNKDPNGRVACVACMMCATACPVNCIHIEAAEAPWPDREKYPAKFDIDELRCIYCGMCEEACPVDAIELTPHYEVVGYTRPEMVFDKEKLLAVYEATKDEKPRKNPPVTDYGLTGGQARDVADPNVEPQV
ncbi:MAG: NADH-quinone oxidoreductase subunit I [Planctomycetota bacterium]